MLPAAMAMMSMATEARSSADSSPPVGVGQVLFTQPILTQPGLRRGVHVVPVSSLSGFLLELQGSGATVEHVFDY